MKKLLSIIAAAGFLSLGFTIATNTPESKITKPLNSEKMDFSHKLDEKRLASWD
ncbi:MAG: hypothetical protein ACO1NS_14595 [Daejeonella sp.]|uniref:hypothetical protein n=1 Tax=Daejeonella sp. JGW-45 TaxID=3034148 RepID=UPI0023ECC19C|nr:hypothetical protein [Daejeonella sp. JGW-45]